MANGKKKLSAVKITLIVFACVGVVAGGMFLLAKRAQNIAKQFTMPQEAEVTRADLSQSVDGTGNLTIDDSIEIKYPSEIKISETLIEQGDDVNKGDIIATVDKSSVTSSIVKLQKELDDVKEQLKNKKKNKLTSYQIEELETRKTELETRLQLMQLYYENPFIIAPESGFVYSMGSSDNQSSSNQISLDNIDISSYLSNTSSDVNDTGSVPVKAADGEGDEGIKGLCSVLSKLTRSNEMNVRSGGDEFFLIGIGRYNKEDEALRSREFADAVARKSEAMNKPYNLSASIGCLVFPDYREVKLDLALSEADEKMYNYKMRHRRHRSV